PTRIPYWLIVSASVKLLMPPISRPTTPNSLQRRSPTTLYKTIRHQPSHRHRRGLPGQTLMSQPPLNPKLLTSLNRLNTLAGHSLPPLNQTRLDLTNHHIMVLTSRHLAAHNHLVTHSLRANHSRNHNSSRFMHSQARNKISTQRRSTRANNPVSI